MADEKKSAAVQFYEEFAGLEHEPYELSGSQIKIPGHKQDNIISVIPIVPTAIIFNVDSHTEKLELSFVKRGKLNRIITERSVTANRNSIIRLADKGVEVNSDNAGRLVSYIGDIVGQNLDKLPARDSKSVMGWYETEDGMEFMPYTDGLVFDGDDQYKHLYGAIKSQGDFHAWIKFMEPYRKKTEVRLCMAAAFASPLIELVGANSFVFHLWGETGTAKTVALLMAMSIYGDPSMGKMTRTMNMTANSMLSTAAFLNNLPFAGDELQTIKSRWTNFDNLIMTITEGIDRGRMKYDTVNEMRSWRCAFLFTGEEPCTKLESGGGVKSRVIEVEVNDKIVEDGNRVANFVRSNYGHAGRAYVADLQRRLRKDSESIKNEYNDIFRKILEEVDTTDKQAGSMALMILGDRIASRAFWPGEKPIEIDDVKPYLFSTKAVDVAERAYEYTVNLISANRSHFEASAFEIWGRVDESLDGDVAYINKLILSEKLKDAGFDFDAVKKKWKEAGRLIPNSQGKLYHATNCHKSKGTYIKLRLPGITDEYEGDDEADDFPWPIQK